MQAAPLVASDVLCRVFRLVYGQAPVLRAAIQMAGVKCNRQND